MLTHLRSTATVHKGERNDAGTITPEKVLEMATIDAARAIGREEDLGSIEAGKLADIVLFDLGGANMTPISNVAPALVYQSGGNEIDTVLCNGEVIMDDREVTGIDERYPDVEKRAASVADDVIERAGLSHLSGRPWQSYALD